MANADRRMPRLSRPRQLPRQPDRERVELELLGRVQRERGLRLVDERDRAAQRVHVAALGGRAQVVQAVDVVDQGRRAVEEPATEATSPTSTSRVVPQES